MEHIKILGAPIESSYIGLGTWAISGVMWGETDEDKKDISADQAGIFDFAIKKEIKNTF
ncbi:hypothetical protein [Bacillus swezeyi]|uniref:hypothetical protein n=1 Tax=Bacillus swezeyi TaxID=1925020 RepID=UPI0039C5DD61